MTTRVENKFNGLRVGLAIAKGVGRQANFVRLPINHIERWRVRHTASCHRLFQLDNTRNMFTFGRGARTNTADTTTKGTSQFRFTKGMLVALGRGLTLSND